jgi:hypothetical protein
MYWDALNVVLHTMLFGLCFQSEALSRYMSVKYMYKSAPRAPTRTVAVQEKHKSARIELLIPTTGVWLAVRMHHLHKYDFEAHTCLGRVKYCTLVSGQNHCQEAELRALVLCMQYAYSKAHVGRVVT